MIITMKDDALLYKQRWKKRLDLVSEIYFLHCVLFETHADKNSETQDFTIRPWPMSTFATKLTMAEAG